MIRIAICDEKEAARREAAAFCHRFFQDKATPYEIMEYASSKELLAEDFPDILLMDIKLGRISGLLVKEILESSLADTRMLFISAARLCVKEAFGRNVYGFLAKPIRYPHFAERMRVMVADIEARNHYTYCETRGVIERIYYKDIVCIEANGRYTKVHVYGEEEEKNSKLGIRKWRELLRAHAFVLHQRKYLVNPAYEKGKVY